MYKSMNGYRGLNRRKTTSLQTEERSTSSAYNPSDHTGTKSPQWGDLKHAVKTRDKLPRPCLRTWRSILIPPKRKILILMVLCFGMKLLFTSLILYFEAKSWDHPIVLSCHFQPEGHAVLKVKRLPIHDEDRYPTKRTVEWSDKNEDSERNLRNSRKYNREKVEDKETNECKLPFEWLRNSHPTCNNLHENDMTQFFNEGESKIEERLLLLDHGFFRDIWTFKSQGGGPIMVLKTLRLLHELTDRNFDRHRRDALIMDHLTSSQNVAQIYSFCGNSIFSEYATVGTVSDQIWPLSGGNSTLTSFERLELALKVARAVSDAHMYDESNMATLAHTDITPSQFLVFNDGNVKINDFNRCRFLLRKKNGENCPYSVSHNPGKFRSPEEYSYTDQTEKVDIYSMGNVFYSIVTELWPFESNDDLNAVQENVTKGIRPPIQDVSSDIILTVLVEIIHLCWSQNPDDRPSARKIVLLLDAKVKELERIQ